MKDLEKLVNDATVELHQAKLAKGLDLFHFHDALDCFAKGYFKYMTRNSIVSDNCLLSSIGFSRAFECLPDYLTHWGFDCSKVRDLRSEFSDHVFGIRNPKLWQMCAFIFSNKDMSEYEKNLNDKAFVKKYKDAMKELEAA